MIFVTGDIHGDINRIRALNSYCVSQKTSVNDYMIILGDVGINYYGDFRDELRKNTMSEAPVTFLCIHGNHENRPQNIGTYIKKEFCGGTVWYEKNHSNILFLQDGETYEIEGLKFLAIGGAYSVDKFYRISRNWTWFPDEQVSEKNREYILKRVSGKSFDYVITHTCPLEWQPTELFLSQIDQKLVDSSMEEWLSQVKNNIEFKEWFFGHYHGDKRYEDDDGIRELFFKNIKKIN